MDFDTGTVQAHRFKSHAEKTFVLQAFKNLVQNTGLAPSAHAHVDCMPVSEPFREPPPFAPIFHDIQNGIEHFKVVIGDIASMDGETIRYTLVLHLANLHHIAILTYFNQFDNSLSEHGLDKEQFVLELAKIAMYGGGGVAVGAFYQKGKRQSESKE